MAKVGPKVPVVTPRTAAPPPPASPPPAAPVTPADSFSSGTGASPGRYDVSDDAALEKLKGGSPADQQLASEITNARASYKKLIDQGAKLYVSRSPGNGGQPVITVVPPSLQGNPNQPFNVQVHYSGKYGTASSPDPRADAATKIGAEMNGPPPTVMVLAEPNNFVAKPDRGTFSPDWSNAKDTRMTANDALKAAGLPASGLPDHPLIVSAHSAGGRAVAAAVQNGHLSCDRLELEDCLYGAGGKLSCADAVKKWAGTPDGLACKRIDYVHTAQGDNGEADALNAKVLKGHDFHRYEKPAHYDAAFFVPPDLKPKPVA